ncbi:CoA pyrophosphatase [Bacillus sp. FSL W7-1360]
MPTIDQIERLFTAHPAPSSPPAKQAAVILPLVTIGGQTHVLFQTRAHTLKKQPGETCFPGGHVEPFDNTLAHAAIRECTEELGLAQTDITMIAPLPKVEAPHQQLVIHPYLANIRDVHQITIDPSEVADWFTIPLAYLLTNPPQIGHFNVTVEPAEDFPIEKIANQGGYIRRTYMLQEFFYTYKGRTVWGLTARILQQFLSHLQQEMTSSDHL